MTKWHISEQLIHVQSRCACFGYVAATSMHVKHGKFIYKFSPSHSFSLQNCCACMCAELWLGYFYLCTLAEASTRSQHAHENRA